MGGTAFSFDQETIWHDAGSKVLTLDVVYEMSVADALGLAALFASDRCCSNAICNKR